MRGPSLGLMGSGKVYAPPLIGDGVLPLHLRTLKAPLAPQLATWPNVDIGPEHETRVLLTATCVFTSSSATLNTMVNDMPMYELGYYNGQVSHRHNMYVRETLFPEGEKANFSLNLWNNAKHVVLFRLESQVRVHDHYAGHNASGYITYDLEVPEGGFGIVIASLATELEGGQIVHIENDYIYAIVDESTTLAASRSDGTTIGLLAQSYVYARNSNAIFADGFNRTVVGSSWVVAGSGIKLANGMVGSNSGASFEFSILFQPLSDNQWCEAEVHEISAIGTGRSAFLLVRADNGGRDNGNGYALRVFPDTNWTWTLEKWAAGPITIASGDVPLAVSGDIFRIEAEGNQIRVLHNGAIIGSVSDNTHTTGTAGTGAYRSSVKVDNFEAGNL